MERDVPGRLVVREQHWRGAQAWAGLPGQPLDVARKLVQGWNDISRLQDGDSQYRHFPETPEFLAAMARLIAAARTNEEVKIVDNQVDDDLCQALQPRSGRILPSDCQK